METKTFKIYLEKKRIVGNVDGVEALKQQMFLYLSIPRFEHIIFSSNIGHDFMQTIGKPKSYILGVAKQYVIDALSVDERIIGVDDFNVKYRGENAIISFKVSSVYGDFYYEREVMFNGQ